MPRRLRLDAELVRRGLARSREHAADLVREGRVRVSGVVATKPASNVTTDVALVVRDDPERPDYVSRGGHKLAGALAAFGPLGLVVAGRRCLDAGASTGGFTDVLLRAGAAEVVAVDVGYGQLAWSLRSDDRVRVLDRTNVRDLTPDLVGGAVDLVVGDLSFISLTPGARRRCSASCVTDGDLALMVKPQFEVGKDRVGKGGVVREPGAARRGGHRRGAARGGRRLGCPRRRDQPAAGAVGKRGVLPVAAPGAPAVGAEEIAAEVARGPDASTDRAGDTDSAVPGEKVDP